MKKANGAGLSYLGDGSFSRIRYHQKLALEPMQDNVPSEQAVIDAENETDEDLPLAFRGTLLCHSDCQIARKVQLSCLANFYASSVLVPEQEDTEATSIPTKMFYAPNGAPIEISNPSTIALLEQINELWPKSCKIADSENTIPTASETEIDLVSSFYRDIVNLFRMSLVDLYVVPPNCSNVLPENPIASPFARLQATNQNWATNLRHEYIMLDTFEGLTLSLLDGTRDVKSLVAKIEEQKDILPKKLLTLDPAQLRAFIKQKLELTLEKFTEAAFFL